MRQAIKRNQTGLLGTSLGVGAVQCSVSRPYFGNGRVYTFWKDNKSDIADEMYALQRDLIALGYLNTEEKQAGQTHRYPNGTFDVPTGNALENVQKDAGLDVTGGLNLPTKEALCAQLAGGSSNPGGGNGDGGGKDDTGNDNGDDAPRSGTPRWMWIGGAALFFIALR